jgi:hypothetical protein
MTVALLLYAYARGTRSSRGIERAGKPQTAEVMVPTGPSTPPTI